MFTDSPITAFPPNRLVVSKQITLPDQLSLFQAMKKYNLSIGAVEGRAYGQHIDEFLLANHDQVIWISGKDSAKRLRQMLIRKKLDAIIEFTATFTIDNQVDLTSLSFHQLKEASQSIYGYIACARSGIGQKAIALFNEQLALPVNQKIIIDAHHASFFGREAIFIAEDMARQFH